MSKLHEQMEAKKIMKKKKPEFLRTDTHKLKFKGADKWRKPKGLHNKMGDNKRGYRTCVRSGYRTPVKLRDVCVNDNMLHVVVNNLNDLKKVDPDTQAIKVGKTVGLKKKLEILKKAVELKVKVANIKDVNKYLNDMEEILEKKKSEKKKKVVDKEERKKKREKEAKEKEEKSLEKAVEKEGSAEEKTEEEKKKEKEKEEKDKVLRTKN